MNLTDTSNFFKNLISKTSKKSERKIYEEFVGIISGLKNMDLSEVDFQSIEKEIDLLKLEEETEDRKKFFNKRLNKFKKYLKDEFSFTTEGYFAGIGLTYGIVFGPGVGMTFGIIIGSIINPSEGVAKGMTLGMTFGTSIGIVLGILIGRKMDAEAEKQNRVMKVKVK